MTAGPYPHYPVEAAREAANPVTPPDRLEMLSFDPRLEAIVAANPSAAGSMLERLRSAQNPATRAAVAGNPNTPLKALLHVAAEFPQEFLDNPVLPLLLLERPSLAIEMPWETVQGLLRCEQVPAALFKPLANHRSLQVRELVKMHVSVAGEPGPGEHKPPQRSLYEISGLIVPGQRWIFALPGLFSPWLLELIAAYGYAQDIAISPDAPPERLEWLAACASAEIAARAARNPRMPVEALVRLATRGNTQISVAVTENPSTPEWLLEELAAHPAPEVRVGVARNPHTPASTLRALGSDQSTGVRAWVARHPRSDAHMLEQLACDKRVSVRACAARNGRTPPRCLEALAADPDPDVRAAAAGNPQLPDSWLERLVHDDDPMVRRAAARQARPETLEPLLDRVVPDSALFEGAAANDRLPGALVTRLGRSRFVRVLCAVAQHPHAPADLLERLAGRRHAAVRTAVARNSRTPLAILEQLARDSQSGVRFALIYNPCTPLALLEQLSEEANPPQMHTIVHHPSVSHAARLQIYTQYFDRVGQRNIGQATLVRLAALAGDFLSPDRYRAGARSTRWIERYVLARNPSAPLDVLEALAHDGIVYVRAAARETLAARAAVKERT